MKTHSCARSTLFNSLVLIAAVVLLLIPQASPARAQNPAAADYDAVLDFSIISNPNGVWSYGWMSPLGSPLNLYTVTDTTTFPGLSAWLESGMMYAPPLVGHNDTNGVLCFLSFCVPPTYLHLHPGPNNEVSVVRWTAPTSGNFFVQGRVVGLDHGGPTSTGFNLVLNASNILFSASINSYKSPISFHHTLTMSAGDTLDCAVDFGNGNYNADSTGIQFKVTQVE